MSLRAQAETVKTILLGAFIGAMMGVSHGQPAVVGAGSAALVLSVLVWAFEPGGADV